jgi:UDP-glucuronate 4-epimerase
LKKDRYILITGAAGFIGFHVAKNLLAKKKKLILVDNLNKYYDQKLKKKRIKELRRIDKNVIFKKQDISNYKKLLQIFSTYKIDKVINLAAQAGVRYSIKKPEVYFKTNLLGFFNILECIKKFKIKKLVYASTSSVYGDTSASPLNENLPANNPIQFYAVTKSSNELMAKAYSKIYNFKAIGLRYFTVYGPWGRPDMALFKFTKNILSKKPIEVFNYGNHFRDFTYIDDVSKATVIALSLKIKNNHEIFNIGKGKSNSLREYIKQIEKNLKIQSKKKYLKLQTGDVKSTHASNQKFFKYSKFKPNIGIEYGIKKFIEWYRWYYKK